MSKPSPTTHSTREVLDYHHSVISNFEEWCQKVMLKMTADAAKFKATISALEARIKQMEQALVPSSGTGTADLFAAASAISDVVKVVDDIKTA